MVVKGFVPCLLLYSNHFQQWKEADQPNLDASTLTRPKPPFIDRALLDMSSIGVGVANIIARNTVVFPSSTYICPSTSYINMLVPWVKTLDVALWCLLLRTLMNVIENQGRWRSKPGGRPFVQSVGCIFIVCCKALSYNTLI